MLPTKDSLQGERHRSKMRRWKNVFHANRNDNKSRVTVLAPDKIDYKTGCKDKQTQSLLELKLRRLSELEIFSSISGIWKVENQGKFLKRQIS